MKKILAIGCGGAGMFSLIVPAQLKKGKFQTTILSDEANIYCRCTTPYTITGEARLKDAIQPESLFTDYGFKIVHEKAINLNTDKKQVKTNKGHIFKYDYLVISTGAKPRIPNIKGLNLINNAFTVRTSADVVKIARFIKKGHQALIIGAGIIGLEMAGALKKRGMKVSIVERGPSISKHLADPEFAQNIIANFKKHDIKINFNSEILEIKKNKSKSATILIRQGGKQASSLKANLIIIAAGVEPNLDIIKGTAIKANRRGILVDREMHTNVKDVFACGDCCDPISAITHDNQPSELASSAIQQAKIVGFQIAGYPIRYAGATGAFAFQSLGKEYAGVGLTETMARKKYKIVVCGQAETTNIYNDMLDKQPLKIKLIFAGLKLRLVGYEAFGNGVIASAEVASFAIGLRLNILSLLKYNYISHPSLTPWPFMNPIIMATEAAMGQAMKEVKSLIKKI